MRVLRYGSDLDRFQLPNCDDVAISYLNQGQFDDTELAATWQPFEVWWDPSSRGERGDFPGFPEPVVSGRASRLSATFSFSLASDGVGDRQAPE